MRLITVATLLALTSSAHADGWFYEQSFGLSSARGGDVPSLETALRLRLGLGWRLGNVSFEPWAAGDLTFQRNDAMFGILGGEPSAGTADLTQYGFDLKYTEPVGRGVSLYMRGGPRFGGGDGTLEHFIGPGVGAGAGIQLSGQVRALGFLWAPLFFVKRGPKITGAVFLDQGVDVYWLSTSHMTIGVPVVSTNLGFAFGTDF
jgi:hypothetical protein